MTATEGWFEPRPVSGRTAAGRPVKLVAPRKRTAARGIDAKRDVETLPNVISTGPRSATRLGTFASPGTVSRARAAEDANGESQATAGIRVFARFSRMDAAKIGRAHV